MPSARVDRAPRGAGISDKPGDEPDVFHTFFGIAGLSLLGADDVAPVHRRVATPRTPFPDALETRAQMDAAHALPVHVMDRIRRRNEGRAAATAATRVGTDAPDADADAAAA